MSDLSALRGMAIGIPARDEAERIDRTLESVLGAARLALPIVVVVAVDSCCDETAAIARRRFRRVPPNVEALVVPVVAGRVGAARQRACHLADTRLRARVGDHAARWIATTDADTTVPADWLVTHRRWAMRGADAIAGLVEVDPADALVPRVRTLMDRERRDAGMDHAHVFGANLGVRASWWHRVGGFPPVAVGEDVMFVTRLRNMGARVVGVPDSVVLTSGRLEARAPDGFGAKLASLTGSPIAESPRPNVSRA
jgi:cellulose synthase/poly-beta-1,6-N-acetylglucosamine synthase-like glycosyltransferase